ncbi:MAG: endopeptidase La [Clostridiales bacterium]|nr:endopeptidase La [Clostridiales bacterium]
MSMEKKEEKILPVLPLRGLTVFPHMVISFAVGRKRSMDSIDQALKKDEIIFLISQKDAALEEPSFDDLCSIGTVARIKQVFHLLGNLTHIIVEGMQRGRILDLKESQECTYARFLEVGEDEQDVLSMETQAMMRLAMESFESYEKLNVRNNVSESVVNIISARKPGQMADVIATGLMINQEQKQAILEILPPLERLGVVIKVIDHELQIIRLKQEIESKVKERIEKTQREFILREQIKVIQEELGDKDGIKLETENFRKRLEEKNLPAQAKEAVEKEIDKFSRIQPSSPESNVSRNYIECLLSLPWTERSEDSFQLKKAEHILEEDHFGLEKVKERILEYLAVRKNMPDTNGPILCLVGPPGVGKTSIARSIARASNRKYVRMSLGGVKDEAEIRGHRKTYIGAMPGRMMTSMRQAGVINPLILLDEIDKMGNSYQGDPASAMLEVLDSEQNNTFTDHYVEVPYDLSHVLFICTANSVETIPVPLLDRMELIELTSYTSFEKKNIAVKHLLPKQIKKYGLSKDQIKVTGGAIEDIIEYYTKESGVRQLERLIASICRKVVKKLLMEEIHSITIGKNNLEEYLGKKKYKYEKALAQDQIGIVRGLAWTRVGGDTLSIEVNTMAGTGKFEVTGNLGNVMKESAQAAISYIRSNGDKLKIHQDFYKDTDIHIHIPEGAVPKDGPSAGITMATAMISALTESAVKHEVAMTGEVTIRGRVLPIGGLKEKVLAAKRAGIQTVILPQDNLEDLSEISDKIKEGMNFVPVSRMEEVLKYAIVEGGRIWK